MDLLEVLEQVRELLERKGRITYRMLQVQFQLDDEQLDTLKEELLFSHPEITEVDGRGLVWNGEAEQSSSPQSEPAQPQPQSPPTYNFVTDEHFVSREDVRGNDCAAIS